MNYLQLCQFVNRQLGDKTELLNSAPLDVTIPFGPLAELCASVNDAYQDIQQQENGWFFRRDFNSLVLIAGTAVYTQAAIRASAPLYERIYPYRNGDAQFVTIVNGVSTTSNCYYIPWEQWGGVVSVTTPALGTPKSFTIRPDETIWFSPPPSAASTSADFYYTKKIDVLTTNTSIPIMPSEWHNAIAWRAIRHWALVRGDEGRFKLADMEYERVMADMRASQLPDNPQTIEPPIKGTP